MENNTTFYNKIPFTLLKDLVTTHLEAQHAGVNEEFYEDMNKIKDMDDLLNFLDDLGYARHRGEAADFIFYCLIQN